MADETKVFVSEISHDDQVVSVFLCRKKSSLVGKTGLPYLSLTLTDKTGNIDAKVWDNVESLSDSFKEGDYVRIKARATTYNGKIQLRVSDIKSTPDKNIDPSDYLPTGPHDTGLMLEELRGIVEELENKYIKELIFSFLDDEEFLKRFILAPAAKEIHHPYLGGLLEHTLSLAKVARLLCSHYSQLDFSLLMAGVFLHDVGKVRELLYERTIGYSDRGRLIGHISLGVEMANERIAGLPGFPDELKTLISHLILSHHGSLEFGSPKRPKIIEAYALSVIDDLDARIFSFQSILDKETSDGRWTNYQRLYDRYLYRWQGGETLSEDGEAEVKASPNHRPTEKPRKNAKGGKEEFQNRIRVPEINSGDEDSKGVNLDLFLPNKSK